MAKIIARAIDKAENNVTNYNEIKKTLDLDPKDIIDFFLNGKLNYLEAHRLILEASRTQTKDFLQKWSYELVFAAEFFYMLKSNRVADVLREASLLIQ